MKEEGRNGGRVEGNRKWKKREDRDDKIEEVSVETETKERKLKKKGK
jgi:hypothetical protein